MLLEKCQSWLMQAIVGDQGEDDPSRWIRSDFGLDPVSRLEIYRWNYPARMTEALQADYPGLLYALGPELFADLTARYVARHPSTSWTLSRLGRYLPAFLTADKSLRFRTFLSELARLEWALAEVFEASEVPTLGCQDLSVGKGLRFHLRPTTRLLRLAYPVSEFLRQVDSGLSPVRPAKASENVLIYRKDFWMNRVVISRPAHDLLQSLARGVALGPALKRRLAYLEPGLVQEWFAQWAEWQIFSS